MKGSIKTERMLRNKIKNYRNKKALYVQNEKIKNKRA
jgi:hypothetical protein